jgi:hypothetical protein
LAAGPAGGFAAGNELDVMRPGVPLAGFADEVTGPGGRCAGASDDQLIGVLRAWDRLESWTAARKLDVIAELIRRRPAPGCSPAGPAAMPAGWGKFCGDELAAAAASSAQTADKTLNLAHDLATRLPATARALHEGTITLYKARLIADATRGLTAAEAAAAEALILDGAAGKTPGQLRAVIARAVTAVNPAAAAARREKAQRDTRVELWREDAGTAALCGRDLPPADALAASQRITAYARDLKAAGLDGTMDQLRARAFLDLTLGIRSHPPHPPSPGEPAARRATGDTPGNDTTADGGAGPDGAEASARANAATGEDPTGQGSAGKGTTGGPGPSAGLAARINLTVPLTTLLGLAERPGEAPGLGAIGPALARTLAQSAVTNPRTTWCVTVTDDHGSPTAHGCARSARGKPPTRPNQPGNGAPPWGTPSGPSRRGGREEPGDRDGPNGQHGTAFTREAGSGPPGGHGRWRLRLTNGRELLAGIEPLAVLDCDHRYESAGYQPSDKLRHLVEIRDGECTWPPCRRAARRCDFEHAVPFDQGGRTCTCNGGPRCRHHHHAKQAPGWNVEQKLPGYHTWTTPAGRTYTTGPTQYPV